MWNNGTVLEYSYGCVTRNEGSAGSTRRSRIARRRCPFAACPTRIGSDRYWPICSPMLTNTPRLSDLSPFPCALSIKPSKRTERERDPVISRQARVLVRDEGPSIPVHEQPHLWERFHRIAGVHARPGTGESLGLGLYINREIVERHGGTIGVESTLGRDPPSGLPCPSTHRSAPHPGEYAPSSASCSTNERRQTNRCRCPASARSQK